MTAGEKARLDSAVKHAGEIIDKLSPSEDSPFLRDMKALQNELKAIPEKPDTRAQKLGEQLGSAVSGLVGENATVNVYVTVNGK
jgi:hypothetical protein